MAPPPTTNAASTSAPNTNQSDHRPRYIMPTLSSTTMNGHTTPAPTPTSPITNPPTPAPAPGPRQQVRHPHHHPQHHNAPPPTPAPTPSNTTRTGQRSNGEHTNNPVAAPLSAGQPQYRVHICTRCGTIFSS